MTAKIRTFRYVRHADVSAYLELGWISPEVRPHPHMDRYRVIMEWPHDRECVEPSKDGDEGPFVSPVRHELPKDDPWYAPKQEPLTDEYKEAARKVWRDKYGPPGQFEAAAFLRDQRWDRGEIAPFRSIADIANRIADKMVADMESERKKNER